MANAIDIDPAGPASELRESGVIEDRPLTCLDQKMRLLNRFASRCELEIRTQSMFGAVDQDAMSTEGFDDLDPDRSDIVRMQTVGGSSA